MGHQQASCVGEECRACCSDCALPPLPSYRSLLRSRPALERQGVPGHLLPRPRSQEFQPRLTENEERIQESRGSRLPFRSLPQNPLRAARASPSLPGPRILVWQPHQLNGLSRVSCVCVSSTLQHWAWFGIPLPDLGSPFLFYLRETASIR